MYTEQTNICKIKVFNIVLYPESDQRPENYVELFTNIFSRNVLVSTYSDRATHLRSFYGPDANGVFHGDISNAIYVNPDSDAIDRTTNEIVPSGADPNRGLGVKIWPFVFVPEFHRIAVVMPFSEKQVQKFLEKAICCFREPDSFAVNVEKDRDVIERIINTPAISRLEVRISYTNNDNLNDWSRLIDGEMRQSNAKSSTTIVTGTKRNPIDIRQSEMLKAYVNLSASNGYTVATVYDDDVAEKVDTSEHPLVETVYYNGNSPVSSIFNSIRRLVTRNHER